ncbi:MAG: DUF736 domain-containing protein [Hyphomonadaceae bacterium]
MTQIGIFTRTADGYRGRLRTPSFDAELVLLPAETSDAENAPDWRVYLGEGDQALEIGAAWTRTGERAGEYLALQFDDPLLARPLRANLFRVANKEDTYHLVWTRPSTD